MMMTSSGSPIPILLMGGIGNRLFQLARAIDVHRTGREPVLIELESVPGLGSLTSRFAGWSSHPMWLNLSDLAAGMGIKCRRPTIREIFLLYTELGRIRVLRQSHRLNLSLDEDRRLAQIGYFQGKTNISVSAIVKIARQLDRLLDRQEAWPKRVLHIRGGDFAEADRLQFDDVEAFVQQQTGVVACVTNDPNYVQSRYPILPIYETGSALGDFATIARAQTIFPSNSTFCFWACAVAVCAGSDVILSGRLDPYWQTISYMKSA